MVDLVKITNVCGNVGTKWLQLAVGITQIIILALRKSEHRTLRVANGDKNIAKWNDWNDILSCKDTNIFGEWTMISWDGCPTQGTKVTGSARLCGSRASFNHAFAFQ